MRIKNDILLHEICGVHVAMDMSGHKNSNPNMLSLNESAACVWNAVKERDFTLDDMVEALTAEYDIDTATARKDCEALLEQWRKADALL